MTTIMVFVDGIGVWGPGLCGWDQAGPVLAGDAPHAPTEMPRLAPALLAPDVRRRCGEHVRLAVQVAAEAVAQAQADATELASVFASSEADGDVTHHICEAVAQAEPMVSPTRFHNSVNNAAAGYWSMAVGSPQPSTSVTAFDATFTAGLLEACIQVAAEARPVLLVAHDTRLPQPLDAARPMTASFAAALVLVPSLGRKSIARLECRVADSGEETRMEATALEALRRGNPAARALPLLEALASRRAGTLALPYVPDRLLQITLGPCE